MLMGDFREGSYLEYRIGPVALAMTIVLTEVAHFYESKHADPDENNDANAEALDILPENLRSARIVLLDKEHLAALHRKAAEQNDECVKRIAATVREDYSQLLRDVGLL